MLRNSDGETEILLGNKQLLGLFVVVVVLLGIAFTGGYKVGQGARKPATVPSAATPTIDETSGATTGTGTGTGTGGGVTQQLPGGGDTGSTSDANTAPAPHNAAEDEASRAAPKQTPPTPAPSHAKPRREETRDLETGGPPARESAGYTPQSGQTFLQVAAVNREQAEGIAEVLRKRGFRAHAVPKPGSASLYRVIIGPVRDAADLNNTRAQLRNNAGFREIIIQHY